MHESAFLASSKQQLKMNGHQTLVSRRVYWLLAPATQANEADIKKQVIIYCNPDPATVQVTEKILIGFSRPQETNPNRHSKIQQQYNILGRDTVE